jgi:structural maintenance of chromosome 2
VISDFDEHFNAITGFNGSGKSNILDAICFVLGISCLSQVRVTTKQEYIYKNGQAGISKANVTILFDNRDKARCHEAYKKFDQISVRREYAVGGNTKCTINGSTVNNDKVLQLFQMSGLNVNNANFLIMQGRITQVINMKPNEIMSLVQETAGTNAYEEIRKKTTKLLEKKESKLIDIDNILTNEVIPIMKQLEKENAEYIAYREKCEQCEALEKKVKAAQYYELREMIQNAEQLQVKYKERLKEFEEKLRSCEAEIRTLDREKQEIVAKAQNLLPEEDKKRLESLKNEIFKVEQQVTSVANENIECDNEIQKLVNDTEELRITNDRGQAEIHRLNENLLKLKDQQAENKQNLEVLKGKLAEFERGGDNSEDFLKTRRLDLARKLENLKEDEKMLQKKIETDQKRIQTRKKELEDAKSRENFDFSSIDQEISILENKLKGFKPLSPVEEAQLKSELNEISQSIQEKRSEMTRFDQNKFACNYQNPEPNFDRSRVKGRMISLIRLNDPKYAKALEAGAGARLFSVVVDTDITGGLLLTKKSFGNVSILPINKTNANICPEVKKQAIYKAFGRKAVLALDVIECSNEVKNTVAFVFGNFFICETKEIAERIAYDPNYKRRAITLEGDSYNPDGIMSGGEAAASKFFSEAKDFKKCEDFVNVNMQKLEGLKKQLREAEYLNESFLNLKNELEIKKNIKNSRLKAKQDSSSSKLQKEIEDIEHNLAISQGEIKQLIKSAKDIEKELKERQSSANPKDAFRKTIEKAENDLKKSTDAVKKAQQDINAIECRTESAIKEIQENDNKRSELLNRLESQKSKIMNFNENLVKLNDEMRRAEVKYESKARDQSRFQVELAEIEHNLKSSLSEKEEVLKSKTTVAQQQREMMQDSDKHLKLLEDLESNHPYIAQMEPEILNFDKAREHERLEILSTERDRLSKRVNKKVSSTLEDHHKRYESLKAKRDIVSQDKQKLYEIIVDLDSKKLGCIKDTWMKVDANLGEIYSMLLPGATARLEDVDELTGLELKVAFNGDWKSNLGELSGGQRSLLALSFILALLKVNPAPIYILDEIDAALDMSHTQNIGMIFKTHFAQSQFIVVSLKEGMFTNANVLFKTQFLEGRSVVERYGIGGSSRRN